MRVLYVAMCNDYGDSSRGPSYEHENFYDSLVNMGHDILYFDFIGLLHRLGRRRMSTRLWDVVVREKPDLLFCVPFKNELKLAVLTRIARRTDTVSVAWFCDDHWRFDAYTKHVAPCFNWAVTTAASAVPKYHAIGYEHVIKSQWACNPFQYRKLDVPARYDVTFVGQPHGTRRWVIEALRSAGVDVRTWGAGWESGRLRQEDMIRIFNESRINLNLSNASVQHGDSGRGTGLSLRGRAGQLLDGIPFGRQLKPALRRVLPERPASAELVALSQEALAASSRFDQIKGRDFEIPGCGGFLLTGQPEGLSEYYQPGKEVATYDSFSSLLSGIRYYLDHEEERLAIANAGYLRTMAEHTYVHRFNEIFRRVGLRQTSDPGQVQPQPKRGDTIVIGPT